MTEPLSMPHLARALASLPGWSISENALVKTFVFTSFRDALNFMQFCTEDIERLDHHPEWTNLYDRIRVRLTTHDAGDRITNKDIVLAKTLDWAYAAR